MTVFFGIFNRSGKGLNQLTLEQMENALPFIKAEKNLLKIIDNIGFGYLLTYNTPESVYEDMPKYLPESNLLFMAKGRIDNRPELCEDLNISPEEQISLSDGDLILKVYWKFGEESVNHLIGDWAFAAFNTQKQELFIARDHHGYTAIDYFISNDIVVFSSNIKVLLALDFIPKGLNEKRAVQILTAWHGDGDNSIYENISHLPPAHTLKITKTKITKRKYWFPEKIKVNNNKSFDEHIIDLEKILYRAVSDRLRSYKPVASMLSGGLDSSTVSYIAADILKKENKELTTYSHVPLYEPSNLLNKQYFGDEKPYILETAEASGNIKPVFLISNYISPLDGIFQSLNIFNEPIHAAINAYWLIDISQKAYKDGFGALLNGENGNATISFTGLDNALPYKSFYKINGLKRTIKRKILRPLVLKFFSELYTNYKNSKTPWKNYSYINDEYAQKMGLYNLMKKENHDPAFNFNFNSSNELLLTILNPCKNLRCYYGSLLSDYFNIEWRDPTADKRLIEYFLTIPNKYFFDEKGSPKQIIKKLMKNKLPDSVLFNKNKGQQSADIGLRINAQLERADKLINELIELPITKKLVDNDRLISDWNNIKAIKNNNYDVNQIHHIFRTISVCYFISKFL